MASEINFAGKRKRFEHAFEQPHHDHFICDVCGRIIEFVDPEIEKKQEMLCRKYKFRGKRHLLQIFGICKVCKL
jgi:Fur family ferric uptake transcriptional regulator